jgi:hypothetical protein
MATVQISDIYNPVTFSQFANEMQIELNRFLASGVAVTSPLINAMATQGGNTGDLTGFKPLGTDEPNYSNDNPAVKSTPKNTTKYDMTYRLASANQSWSTMDIANELALADPVEAITSKIGQYWATQLERRLIQSSLGVLASNVANDNGDMVVDISTDDALPVTEAETISGNSVIDTMQTSGDHGENFVAIAMHSAVFRSLQKQNLIDYIPNSVGVINIPQYLGLRVIVDDSMPAVAGSNRINYTSVLFGAGAFATGEGRVKNASEIDREPSAGNGGGEEIIYSRRSDIIHPLGFNFTSASVAGQSATQTELNTSNNWTRVWERKNINLAFLQTNA